MMISSGIQRNAITSTVAIRSPIRVALVSTSDRLERAEAPRDQEVEAHHDDRYRRESRGEGNVRLADLLLDDVADEARARTADEQRRDEVAEGQREQIGRASCRERV